MPAGNVEIRRNAAGYWIRLSVERTRLHETLWSREELIKLRDKIDVALVEDEHDR